LPTSAFLKVTMPIAKINDRKYVVKQYRSASNLKTRLGLHQRFSINAYGWHRWVFDQFNLPPVCRMLELGCGPGTLWLENIERIPFGWEIILSDFSAGMVEEASNNLGKCSQFQFKVFDAQSIPFEGEYFDAVVANHMLYHVTDRPAALSEVRRVLKPAGYFYASTIGERHLCEIANLLSKFDAGLASWLNRTDSFTLENGKAQLSQWFPEVKIYRYEDALKVTEVAPLVDYILSGRVDMPGKKQDQFRQFVAREMESRDGVFHVTKDSGLFMSTRKEE
jgi:ubiquinone/menaquinone biosynthesis C-methylase UbiE